jgi:hypothetical protein
MGPPLKPHGELTPHEREAVQAVLDRIANLARFLEENPVPEAPDAETLYAYLARMKEIQGNTDNGVSLVACLMAKDYLGRHLPMASYEAAAKPTGAPGLDIDERTTTNERVVAEVKTTVPYGAKDLGNAQKTAFEKDFEKLNEASAAHKFLFVSDRRTFDLLRLKYAPRIPGVTIVLLPMGESFVA